MAFSFFQEDEPWLRYGGFSVGIHLKKEKVFILCIFLRKDGLIGFAWQCDNFDSHSMVNKMVIDFF